MFNFRMVFRILGTLAFMEAFLLLGCTLMAFLYQEDDFFPFIYSTGIAFGAAFLLKTFGRKAPNQLSRRDGYLVISLSWLLFCIIGMLPFLFSYQIQGITNAFFETMSGFTSTGTSIMDNIDECPHALLFWRSLTQWIGGLGIVLFTIAVLPGISMGGVRLFAAQCTGPLPGKLQPRIVTTSQWILAVYMLLTIACAISLWLCGMNLYDAINHTFACIGTGGFSTHQDNIIYFDSPSIEYVLIIFMFLAAINYNLLYFSILKGRFGQLLRDSEFKWYISIFLIATLICSISLYFDNGLTAEESFRNSAFQIISLYTSTGFCSHDYNLWAPKLMPILFFVIFVGGCSGSSASGFKTIRLTMLVKILRNEIRKVLHPNAVIPLRVSGQVVPTGVKITLLAFTAVFILTFFLGWMGLMFCGLPFEEAMSCSISCISNVGPGFGSYGPTFSWSAMSDGGKWICSALMYLGRLEIMPIILLFTRGFWKQQ